MSKSLLGLIFLFFNFTLFFGIIEFNILPDFVGYILLYFGAKELGKRSIKFNNVALIAAISFFISVILSFIAYLSTGISDNVFELLSILTTCIVILLLYLFVRGIKDLEKIDDNNYGSKFLFISWMLLTAFALISYLILLLPDLTSILAIVNICSHILFISSFYRSTKMYNDYR